MPAFAWEGRSRAGDTRNGVMEAETEVEVTSRLRAMGISLTKVRNKGRDIKLPDFLRLFSGVGQKDLVIFTRQLATMIDAGLPIVQCLEILSSQTENKTFARILAEVKASVESGRNFSESLRKHPRVFSELYVNLVAAGE